MPFLDRCAPLFFVLKLAVAVVLSLGTAVTQWLKARALRKLHLRRRAPGFTLIEIGVVLCIVVMLMGIAIPAFRNVTGMQAKAEMGKLMANIRATRGHSAVAGDTCRMVFDLDAGSYSVECTKGFVSIAPETARGGEQIFDKKLDKPDKDLTESEKMKKKILQRVKFAALPTLPSQKLKGDIAIESVWTSHQEDKYVKGKAYLYFFPSGSSENADIVLRWGEDYYTVQVTPMVGKVSLLEKKVEKTKETRDDFF